MKRLETGKTTRRYAPRTVESYVGAARAHVMKSELATRSVDDITRNEMYDELLSMSSGVRAHVMIVWKGAYQVADGDVRGHPPRSPLDGLKIPKTGAEEESDRAAKKKRSRVYTDRDIHRLLKRIDEDPYATSSGARDIIALAVETGCRINELNSVRWVDVDLESDPPNVTIAGQVVRRKGNGLSWEPILKNNLSHRTLPMTPAAMAVLRRRQALRQDLVRQRVATESVREFVFWTPRRYGMPDHDAMTKTLRRTFDAAGFPDMTLHSIRRVVERRLEEAGLSRMDRESIMGHTVEVAERHYSTHGVPERGVEALSRNTGTT